MLIKYVMSREGFGPRGLQSLCEEMSVPLSNVEEFGRHALTINLDADAVKRLKNKDPLIILSPYEGLRTGQTGPRPVY